MIWRVLSLCGLLLLLGCGRNMSQSNGDAVFLALGDSYTIGEAVPESQRWPNLLAERLRAEGRSIDRVTIVATTGWTTDELSRGMDEASLRGPYAHVSLLIGVNNQYRGRSVDAFATEFAGLLNRAIELAGGDASRVFVVSIPDWGVMPFADGRDRPKIAAEIDAFNAVCRQQSAGRSVRFVDITDISRRAATQPSLAAEDGLHPSGAQYQLWAERIAEALR
jgi:lysophospholipase L1-like esterase